MHPRTAAGNAVERRGRGFYGSILPAVWNFQLALRSRGLGSVFTTLHLAYEREAGELLGIPETVTQAALIPVAYTVGTDFKPAARRPIEQDHVLERLEANLMTIELVPLATMRATLATPFVLDGTPVGRALHLRGRRSAGRGRAAERDVEGSAAADWLVVGPDGTGTLDVRMLLETHDGAAVFMQYNGRVDLASGAAPITYTAPRFETGDDRYRWLNKIQAVGKGELDGDVLVYELYELDSR